MKKYNDSPRAQANRAMSGGRPYKQKKYKRKSRRVEDSRTDTSGFRKAERAEPAKRKDTKMDYQQYLDSDRWKEKRDRIIKKAGGKCRFCGKPATAVHHETYKRRGREKDVDLTAVCNHCHAMLHRKYDQTKR